MCVCVCVCVCVCIRARTCHDVQLKQDTLKFVSHPTFEYSKNAFQELSVPLF